MASTLMRFGTTASVSIIPPVDLMVSLLEYPNMPQSSLTQLLLYGGYPPSRTFSLNLSYYMPHSGCGVLGGVSPLLRQLS